MPLMMSDDVLSQLSAKIGRYKIRGDEYIFETCPISSCGNDHWNFQVNFKKNAYHCWVCGTHGSCIKLFYQYDVKFDPDVFMKDVGNFQEDQLIPPQCKLPLCYDVRVISLSTDGIQWLKISQQVKEYLSSRNISDDDIKRYNIKWWPEEKRIIIPIYDFWTGKNLVYWVARTIYKGVLPRYHNPSFPRKGKILGFKFDPNGYINDREEVYIVEGIFDAIRLNKEHKTVLMLLGSDIDDTIIDFFKLTNNVVVLCLDSDIPSKQLKYEEKFRFKLGSDRVKAIYLPEGDVAEYGVIGGEGFVGYVNRCLEIKV